MVIGIELFKQYFRNFPEDYILIGGVACDLILNIVGREFRPTKDFDIVIVSENLKAGFGKRLKEFIRDGGYVVQCRKSTGKPTFFRFVSPKNGDFPSQLELASNKPADDWVSDFVPLDAGDAKSSLSAILFEAEYYSFIRENTTQIDEITTISLKGLIPLKALAYLKLSLQENPTEKNLIDMKKHADDIIMLAEALSSETFRLSSGISIDLHTALSVIEQREADDSRHEQFTQIRRFYELG